MADATLPANQDRIINACAPQPFTQFTWPANHVTAEDSDTKTEVDHCISQFWAKHVRQLSRLATKVRANLRINTERMKASPNTWQPARDEITRRIMADYAELERVTESFTFEMSGLTMQTLGLDRANTRGRPHRDEAEIEECVRNDQVIITAHLDRVDTQLEAIQQAYFLYLFINPPPQLALPAPVPPAGDGPQPPEQDHQGRYKLVESFLGSKRDKVIFDVNTQILTRED